MGGKAGPHIPSSLWAGDTETGEEQGAVLLGLVVPNSHKEKPRIHKPTRLCTLLFSALLFVIVIHNDVLPAMPFIVQYENHNFHDFKLAEL